MRDCILLIITLFFGFTVQGQTITGSTNVCAGGSNTLTGIPSGGTWTSSNPAIATVSLTGGVVTGISAGSAIITYTESGSPVTEVIIVNETPVIGGTLTVCTGATTTLVSAPSGFGVWSSSNPAVASINPLGVVTGNSPGTATIDYVFSTTGCFSSVTVTVNAVPASITGVANVCIGSTTTLYNTAPGGLWTSSNIAIATAGISTGVITGISPGSAHITYTLAGGCFVTNTITANPLPAPITGSSFSICAGTGVSLTSATPGGTWSSSAPDVATVGLTTGFVAGLLAGTTTINYTIMPSTCATIIVISVNVAPAAISGPSAVCAGNTIPLSDATAGGTWASSNTSVATVGSGSGTVTGVSAGTAAITYQLGTGCYAIRTITVNLLPASITGPPNVCTGASVSLTSGTPGGTWSTSSAAVLTVHSVTGTATGITAGVAVTTYSLSGTGCFTSRIMTVNPMPGPITGTALVCAGATTTLSNAVAGGLWVSDATTVATVGAGIGSPTTLTGISAGIATISYITGSGCMATRIATVDPAPAAGTLSGPSIVCAASAITLTSTVTGGVWASSAPAIASVSSGGVVTGVTAGAATITYTVTTGCGSGAVTRIVTVSVAPTAITGTTVLCAGATTTLSDTVPGGSWSSSVTGIAIIGSATGIVTGIAAGTATISYVISSGCFVTTTVSVNPAPGPITGAGTLCVGSVLTLSDSVPGGVWGSSAPGIAIVATVGSTTGVVTGMSAGTAIITYSLGSCPATVVVSVNSLPSIAATLTPDACGGAATLGASGSATYSWSPSTGLSCTTCANPSITPAATVTYTVTGTNATGCANSATVTVNGNRIYGHITFSAATPPIPDLKVWLIQYNPTDSSITATDSALTCLDGIQPYFQFDSKPAGNYMVKAKLLSSVAGTSGYLPTYGASTPNWYTATSITHSSTADMQDINMIYGTVPTGSGFISGYVYSGAGKGTAGEIPEGGMLIYLKDAVTGQVLTYTHTNAGGSYTFGSLAFSSYIIYPEDYDYYTTPAPTITLSPSSVSATGVSFKKHTVLHTIFPFAVTGIGVVAEPVENFSIYPNPATRFVNISWAEQQNGTAKVAITNMTGGVALTKTFIISNITPSEIDISSLSAGIYFINVQAAGANYTGKLLVAE